MLRPEVHEAVVETGVQLRLDLAEEVEGEGLLRLVHDLDAVGDELDTGLGDLGLHHLPGDLEDVLPAQVEVGEIVGSILLHRDLDVPRLVP